MLLKTSFTKAVSLGTVLFVGVGGVGMAATPSLFQNARLSNVKQSNAPSNIQPNAQSNASLRAIEQAVHVQINQYRRAQGLSPLALDERISQQARLHSQAMAQQRRLSHDDFDERLDTIDRLIPYRSASENVAYNQGVSDPARRAVTGWINSPGHRENIEGSFNFTGIGVAQIRPGEYYFTQVFVFSRPR